MSMHKNQKPEFSIVIVSHNNFSLLERCIRSIYQTQKSEDFEIIVVDNHSQENLGRLKRLFPKIKFTKLKQNCGFSRANNIGISHSEGKFLLFLNSDTEVLPRSIEALLNFAHQQIKFGAIAPKLINLDGTIQASCYRFPTITGAINEFFLNKKGSYEKYYPKQTLPLKVDCAVGACLLIQRALLDRIGGWDENYFIYYEDIEMGRKIKHLNLDFWYLPQATIIHAHGKSASETPELSNKWLKQSSVIYNGRFKHLLITFIIKTATKLNIYHP